MSNIVYLSQNANPNIGNRIVDKNDDHRISGILQDADACIVKIADFRDTVRQALDNSWTILDNLNITIADVPDPDERSMLENKLRQAREIALVNSRIIFRAVESMAASARTIRARAHEIVGCKTHAHESSGSSDGSQ